MDVSELTAKDKLFIDTYFENNFNATQAYKTAFKVAKSTTAQTLAFRLMSKDIVKKEIERRFQEIRDASVVRYEELLLAAKNVLLDAIENKDRTDQLKAIDTLNKMTGVYVQKIDANVTGNINLIIPGLDTPTEEDKEE